MLNFIGAKTQNDTHMEKNLKARCQVMKLGKAISQVSDVHMERWRLSAAQKSYIIQLRKQAEDEKKLAFERKLQEKQAFLVRNNQKIKS